MSVASNRTKFTWSCSNRDSMIVLRNIEKYFEHGPSKTFVLRRISVDIKEGEFVSIMGPSGAGKSTLLHILGMHDADWSGEYVFLDQPVHTMNAKQRAELHKRYIGFVFQSYHLLDNLTVYENLEIPLSYRNVSRKDRQGMVADVLDRFQIVGKKDLYPNQLSGGQQQLVGVARAVIANPQVVLADEPTGNLHSAQGKEIMELFRTLNEGGATIVQVTHSEVNASYGSRIINLRDGWIVGEWSARSDRSQDFRPTASLPAPARTAPSAAAATTRAGGGRSETTQVNSPPAMAPAPTIQTAWVTRLMIPCGH